MAHSPGQAPRLPGGATAPPDAAKAKRPHRLAPPLVADWEAERRRVPPVAFVRHMERRRDEAPRGASPRICQARLRSPGPASTVIQDTASGAC
jgi:hypothetical protein